MKVSELIKNSSWTTAQGFENLKPEITVLLPTYRRGDNGLLQRCIDSLLKQTFFNFELIIIDDASIDSSSKIIQTQMQTDARLASIRHQKNVGLPAISVNEGILKARSNKIFFAFDDNEFLPQAIELLVKHQATTPGALITFGRSLAHCRFGNVILGNRDFDLNYIRSGNYIPNSPMLVDKTIFHVAGMFDPHICITRLCDWDLWIRIGKVYQIYRINETLVHEFGPQQIDSLENSHHLDMPLVREWMNRDRDTKLMPENFLDYDVTEIPPDVSQLSKSKIGNLISDRFTWLDSSEKNEKLWKYVIVAVDQRDDAKVKYTDDLNSDLGRRFIVINLTDLYKQNHFDFLCNASAVILSCRRREGVKFQRYLRALTIPTFTNEASVNDMQIINLDKETLTSFLNQLQGVTSLDFCNRIRLGLRYAQKRSLLFRIGSISRGLRVRFQQDRASTISFLLQELKIIIQALLKKRMSR